MDKLIKKLEGAKEPVTVGNSDSDFIDGFNSGINKTIEIVRTHSEWIIVNSFKDFPEEGGDYLVKRRPHMESINIEMIVCKFENGKFNKGGVIAYMPIPPIKNA